MEARPIPAFYCCYLLRSTVRHSALYVGSTPNPTRRLAQHNGLSKGGAVRTSREILRPWEMVCIVTGFPSNIAALQFEWAWQNAHLTRKIPAFQRITPVKTPPITPGSGRPRRRPHSPRVYLTDRLGNLHLLLRVQSFIRWPLEVRFFNEDVYRVWQQWTQREAERLRDGIKVVLDLKRELPVVEKEGGDDIPPGSQVPKRRAKKATRGDGGIEDLDVGLEPIKEHVEKSVKMLAECESLQCAVCRGEMNHQQDLVATCPIEGCMAASHLTCLSRHFLTCEGEKRLLLPIQGMCPGCSAHLRWVDTVKELTLRVRGKKDLKKLLKKNSRVAAGNKSNGSKKVAIAPTLIDEEDNSETEESVVEDGEVEALELQSTDDTDEPFYYHEYSYVDDGDDDDLVSVTSADNEARSSELHTARREKGKGVDVVIEDSDWDDAEVLY
ncbi:MAG: Slx4p interacting protein [Trichoglossum hirsutum]|nr:MAG: Slx4p interacting protein [Trichoglossum hirsutum]